MGKVETFTVLYSLVLIGLFAVSCYLMSIVHPARINYNDTVSKNFAFDSNSSGEDSEKLSEIQMQRYIDRVINRMNLTYLTSFNTSSLPANQESDGTGKMRSWAKIDGDQKPNSKSNIAVTEVLQEASTKKQLRSMQKRHKAIDQQDRPLNNREIDHARSVLLKLSEKQGESINIPNGTQTNLSSEKNRNQKWKEKPAKTDFSMHVENDETLSFLKKYLLKNTVIELLPNNTLTVDNIENYKKAGVNSNPWDPMEFTLKFKHVAAKNNAIYKEQKPAANQTKLPSKEPSSPIKMQNVNRSINKMSSIKISLSTALPKRSAKTKNEKRNATVSMMPWSKSSTNPKSYTVIEHSQDVTNKMQQMPKKKRQHDATEYALDNLDNSSTILTFSRLSDPAGKSRIRNQDEMSETFNETDFRMLVENSKTETNSPMSMVWYPSLW